MSESECELAAALERYHMGIAAEQRPLLKRYFRLLRHWNERLNLTRHTTCERFVARDVADSLALAACIDTGERVLDVGTGGGVPGLILAILRPDLSMTVCESVGKKARAVEAMATEMGLPVRVHHARAEELLTSDSFDTLVARAVAPLAKLLGWLGPCRDGPVAGRSGAGMERGMEKGRRARRRETFLPAGRGNL
jgi:16S rRNA (guanine527-N7)-methyltransferase